MNRIELLTAGVTDPESAKGLASRGFLALASGFMSIWIAVSLYLNPGAGSVEPLAKMSRGPLWQFFGVVGVVMFLFGAGTIGSLYIAARRAQEEGSEKK